jgi:hypothetical protein
MDNDWRVSTMSQDGQKMMLAESPGSNSNGRIFLSTDHGTTFSEVRPAGDADLNWQMGTISKDGNTLLAGVEGGRLYLGLYPLPVTSSGVSFSSASMTTEALPWLCTDEVSGGTPDLFQVNRFGKSATLYFSPVEQVSQYHVVFGYSAGDQRFGLVGARVTPTSNMGVQTVVIHNLSPQTNYWFTVAPVNGCAVGSWSNWLEAKGSGSRLMKFYHWQKK